ncbi:hypothetical protein RCC89_00390 [Cytophagaceae bacterium ABcell3]|nr:hypothetical protein RCC89_00390 [Cytophagaceae bacterium ABcell3]
MQYLIVSFSPDLILIQKSFRIYKLFYAFIAILFIGVGLIFAQEAYESFELILAVIAGLLIALGLAVSGLAIYYLRKDKHPFQIFLNKKSGFIKIRQGRKETDPEIKVPLQEVADVVMETRLDRKTKFGDVYAYYVILKMMDGSNWEIVYTEHEKYAVQQLERFKSWMETVKVHPFKNGNNVLPDGIEAEKTDGAFSIKWQNKASLYNLPMFNGARILLVLILCGTVWMVVNDFSPILLMVYLFVAAVVAGGTIQLRDRRRRKRDYLYRLCINPENIVFEETNTKQQKSVSSSFAMDKVEAFRFPMSSRHTRRVLYLALNDTQEVPKFTFDDLNVVELMQLQRYFNKLIAEHKSVKL